MTHSVLLYLGQRGVGLERVIDATRLPTEFLHDSSAWIPAADVETFFSEVSQAFSHLGTSSNESLLVEIGHTAPELKGWGTLDSVLRMVESPSDILNHPGRFLSYFLSVEPKVNERPSDSNHKVFELSLSLDDFPLSLSYLLAAMEALPEFQGLPRARVSWDKNCLEVEWAKEQKSLLSSVDLRSSLKPEFMASLVNTLETTQRQLDDKIRELSLRDRALQQMRSQLESLPAPKEVEAFVKGADLNELKQSVLTLGDYLNRACQLVTLMSSNQRAPSLSQELKRRLDWHIVMDRYPEMVRHLLTQIEELGNLPTGDKDGGTTLSSTPQPHESFDLNDILEGMLKESPLTRKNLKIEKLLFLDRPVQGAPKDFRKALKDFLQASLVDSSAETKIRFVTRPSGSRAEFEFLQTGLGGSENQKGGAALKDFENFVISQNGKFQKAENKGMNQSFVVHLPTEKIFDTN